jgi:hypothetical protein
MRSQPLKVVSLVTSLSVLGLTLLVGCGKKDKPAEDATTVQIDNNDEFDDGREMMQEKGGMNEDKVTKTFERLQPNLTQCLMSSGKGADYLYGDVAFLVVVDRKGEAVQAYTERSNLGSYDAEKCMLDVLRKSRWPKPVGGLTGDARNGMGYDAPPDIRPPVEWSAEDIEETLTEEENAETLNACGRGGPYEITMYVSPSGRVLSAGVAHTVENGEETASCIVGALEGMKFNSPGSWRAKVTFRR